MTSLLLFNIGFYQVYYFDYGTKYVFEIDISSDGILLPLVH